MSVLLMLVILGMFITSSQAVTCYSCNSFLSSNCDDPFSSGETCSGYACYKIKGESESSGLLTICYFRSHREPAIASSQLPN